MVLDGNSSQEYPVNAAVPLGSILGPTLLLPYIDDLPNNGICDTAVLFVYIFTLFTVDYSF